MTRTRIKSRIKTAVLRNEFTLHVLFLYQQDVQKALRRFDGEKYILQRVENVTSDDERSFVF